MTLKQTVLIIDDDESEGLITRRVLSKIAPALGADTALSGETGLGLLRGGNPLPAMILLDLKMPGLSGIDALRQIRADDRLRHLPVIIVTNSTLESDRQKAIEAGADDYLHKDFNIEHFRKNIEYLLKRFVIVAEKE
jgi:DNA-binding response OmpR family regulator